MPSPLEELRYPTHNDTALRLLNSVVRYNKEYVWVSSARTDADSLRNNVLINYLDPSFNGKTEIVSANDVKFDVTSPELGWFHSSNLYVYYIARANFRKQKQGISNENLLMFFPQVSEREGSPSEIRMDNSSLIGAAGWRMLTGKYETFANAIALCLKTKAKTSQDRVVGAPLSKEFCLVCSEKKVFVYRRLVRIGEANEAGVTLYPMFNNSLVVTALANLGAPTS